MNVEKCLKQGLPSAKVPALMIPQGEALITIDTLTLIVYSYVNTVI